MKRIFGCKVSATTYDVPISYYDVDSKQFVQTVVKDTTVRNAVDLKKSVAADFNCKTSQVMIGNFERHTASMEIDCTIAELMNILDSAGIAHSDIETSK